jgi:hypothetical protein
MSITEQFDAVALSHQSLTVDATAGGVALPSIPAGAREAYITVETAPFRFTYDGTAPTASVGHLKVDTDEFVLKGRNVMKKFRAFRTTGVSSVLRITYHGITR